MTATCSLFKSTLWILLCPLLLMACAHQAPTRSGFLSDYAGLRTHDRDPNLETVSIPGEMDFGRIRIEPVRFVNADATKATANADQNALCRVLEEALAREFYDLAPPRTGPARTLRIKAAVTGANSSRPLLNLLTSLVIFVPVDNGGISVEIEAIEEETGRRVAAMSGARNGSPFAVPGFFSRYGHAEAGLKELAREFRHLVPPATAPAPRLALH